MDSNDLQDPFSDQVMSNDLLKVDIEDIKFFDDCDSVDGSEEEDMSIMEIAMAKAIDNVNPTLFMHLLCPHCGETFVSPAGWQQHLHIAHFFNNLKKLPGNLDEETFCCNQCPAEFNYLDYRKILLHCLSHMTFNAYYKCSLCDHLECTGAKMSRHIRRHMEVHMLKAKINGKIVRPQRFSLSENIDYGKFLLYMCPECQLTFRQYDLWLQHVTDEHELFAKDKIKFKTMDIAEGDERKSHLITTCEICATTLANNDLEQCQRKHYLTHLRYRAFRCAICDLHFNYSGEIKMHMLLLHCKNIETYEEALLPANLRPNNAKFNLNVKFRPEKGAKFLPYVEFNCPICSVKFLDGDNWRHHINENHDFFKAPYMALLITNFRSSTNTEKACKKRRRLQPYCVLCNRALDIGTNHTLLWKEQLRHAPYRAYTCRICLEQFYSLRLLMAHLRLTHKNEDGTINLIAKKRRSKYL